MSVIDKAKMAMQVFKMKKEIENVTYYIDENNIEISAAGFMAMSEPNLKSLKINGVENRVLLEMINKILKKTTEASMKKMQELGKDLEGAI